MRTDHCLTQFLCVRLAEGLAERDLMGRAVVPQDRRVIDRHVGRALLVVSGWISPGYHDPSNEGVGIVDGGGRIVDEARLDNPPLVVEAPGFVVREVSDVVRGHAHLAGRQLGFRAAGVAKLRDRSIVFGPELLAKPLAVRKPLLSLPA